MREARQTVRIKSEHVVRVLDVLPDGESWRYIVMEHLEGEDLRAVLEREGPLSPGRCADFLLQVCEAVASAQALFARALLLPRRSRRAFLV